MLEQLHIASQYLASFAINYLDHQPDDSHSNLAWDIPTSRLISHPTDQGIQLALEYGNFSLCWLNKGDNLGHLLLDGKSHHDILEWINQFVSDKELGEPLKYEFHYELPYPAISSDYVFSLKSSEEVEQLGAQLTAAKIAFESFLAVNRLNSDIRVWPHHFDLGIYAKLKDDLFLGAGLAVPDTMITSLYYYASGWNKGDAVDTSGFKELTAGKWMSPEWNGGVLASAVQQDPNQILTFLNESYSEFVK